MGCSSVSFVLLGHAHIPAATDGVDGPLHRSCALQVSKQQAQHPCANCPYPTITTSCKCWIPFCGLRIIMHRRGKGVCLGATSISMAHASQALLASKDGTAVSISEFVFLSLVPSVSNKVCLTLGFSYILFISLSLFICLSLYLSISLSLYLSISLSLYFSISPSLHLSIIYLSIFLFFYLSIYLSIHIPIVLSINQSINCINDGSIYPSVYLRTYLPTSNT
jgi:hypothetical protein